MYSVEKSIIGFKASSIYLDSIFTGCREMTQDTLHFMYGVSPAYINKWLKFIRPTMNFMDEFYT